MEEVRWGPDRKPNLVLKSYLMFERVAQMGALFDRADYVISQDSDTFVDWPRLLDIEHFVPRVHASESKPVYLGIPMPLLWTPWHHMAASVESTFSHELVRAIARAKKQREVDVRANKLHSFAIGSEVCAAGALMGFSRHLVKAIVENKWVRHHALTTAHTMDDLCFRGYVSRAASWPTVDVRLNPLGNVYAHAKRMKSIRYAANCYISAGGCEGEHTRVFAKPHH